MVAKRILFDPEGCISPSADNSAELDDSDIFKISISSLDEELFSSVLIFTLSFLSFTFLEQTKKHS